MNWLNDFDAKMFEEVGAEEISSGTKIESGVYQAKVAQAFVRTTDNKAKMLHIDFDLETGSKLSYSTCVQSGEAKGCSTFYTDKNGNKKLMPGLVEAKHFFEAIGLDMTKEQPKGGRVKYGKDDAVIDAGIFENTRGKTLTLCVRLHENEYNNEITLKPMVEHFLNIRGENFKGENLIEKFKDKIGKYPIKTIKKDTAKSEANGIDQAAAVASGW